MVLTPLTHLLYLQLLKINAKYINVGWTLSLMNLQKARDYLPLVGFISFPALASSFALFVNLQLNPTHKGKKKRGEINIGKQAQYLTNDHPAAACFSHLVYHL